MKGRSPQASAGPLPERFRRVLGRFATGVGVMTTAVDGTPHAMTANAFTSVSLEPPLVLVCVDRRAIMATRVRRAGCFAVTFLAADQTALSAWFADPSRPDDASQFAGIDTRTVATGAPVLAGGVGYVDCRLHAVHDGGDHLIVVGRVVALEEGPADEPLLYYGSAYGRLEG